MAPTCAVTTVGCCPLFLDRSSEQKTKFLAMTTPPTLSLKSSVL